MRDLEQVADRIEIEALRAEFTDAVMMREPARIASLFTEDGALRMPDVPVEAVGTEQIRQTCERLQEAWDFFVQTGHPGTVRLYGDKATGRTYLHELARLRDGRQGQNFGVYHDHYQRTTGGWRFAERVYEVRYFDASPLGGSAGAPASEESA